MSVEPTRAAAGAGSGAPVLDPALRWALSSLLPGPDERWLLKAILLNGDEAGSAWVRFRTRVPDVAALFRTDTGGRKRLGPLLLQALRRVELAEDPHLLTVLRTAYLREELRARAYADVVDEVLGALAAVEVEPLVLKGAALAPTVYAERCLRHAHDVDLLVRPDEQERAGRALHEAGLSGDRRTAWGRVLRHRTEVPVQLWSRLYRPSVYESDIEGLRSRSRSVRLGDRHVRVLSEADNMVHALGHASYCPSRSSLLWAVDACMLSRSPGGVDWPAALEALRHARLELPLYVMVNFLHEELALPVPATTLDDLARLAARAGGVRRDLALYGARQVRGSHPWLASGPPGGWRDRLKALWWRLFPSPEYVRFAFGPRHTLLIPLLYLARPWTYAWSEVRWRVARYRKRRASPNGG